jgi:hypothetical protein
VKIKLFFAFNYVIKHYAMKAYGGRYSPTILDLDTRRKRTVTSTPLLLHPRGYSP